MLPSRKVATANPNQVKDRLIAWIQKYQEKITPLLSKNISDSSTSELRSLRNRLEYELTILNDNILICYAQDKRAIDLIHYGLQKIKLDKELCTYYDNISRYFGFVKNNMSLILPQQPYFDEIASKYCINLVNLIYNYDKQKCITTNVVVFHMSNIKHIIHKLSREIEKRNKI
jgi:hypothetical protein